jgi:hypothetical protein
LSGDWSPGAGAVGAGGLDLFFGSHWLGFTQDEYRMGVWGGVAFPYGRSFMRWEIEVILGAFCT